MKSLLNKTIALGLLTGSLVISTQAHAQQNPSTSQTPTVTQKRDQVIEKREQEQQNRIQQGVKSGELKGKEAQRLENEQTKIKGMEDKAEADGKIAKKEMRRIEKAQDRASKDIYKKKHNKRKRKDGTVVNEEPSK
ncbi:MAG: hypothetical protein ACXWQQ_13250 [Pseudobdellovibrio sp.]